MKEIIKVNNKYKGLTKEEITIEVTKKIEKLINEENKRAWS